MNTARRVTVMVLTLLGCGGDEAVEPAADAATVSDAASAHVRLTFTGEAPGQVAATGTGVTARVCTASCDIEFDAGDEGAELVLELGTPGRLGEVLGATCDGRACVVLPHTPEVTIRFDATPEQRFSRFLPLDDELVSIDRLPDGAILVGTASATHVLEPDGTPRWRSELAGGEARPTSTGDVLVLSPSGVTRLSGEGEFVWAQPLEVEPDIYNPMSRALAPSDDDGAFVAGYASLIRIAASGDVLWTAPLIGGRQAVATRGEQVLTGVEADDPDGTDLLWYGEDGTPGPVLEYASNQYAFALAVDTSGADGDVVCVSAGHSNIWLDRYADDLTPVLETSWAIDSLDTVEVGVAANGPRTAVLAGNGQPYGYVLRAYDGADLVWMIDEPGTNDDVGWSGVQPRDLVHAAGADLLIGGTYVGPGGNMAWVALIGRPAP